MLIRRTLVTAVALVAALTGHAVATRQFRLTPSADRSVVIHALSTDPAGFAGPRLACTTMPRG